MHTDLWTLTPDELRLLDAKIDHTRLGCALLLKYFVLTGRFPQSAEDVPEAAVAHVGRQVGVPPEQFQQYQWRGRTIKDHRAQIREALGVRRPSVADAQALADWLAERDEALASLPEQLKLLAAQRCRDSGLELPTPERLERLVRSALRAAGQAGCQRLCRRLPAQVMVALDAWLVQPEPDTDTGTPPLLPLHELKADPGRVSLDSLLSEIAKLHAVRQVGLPVDLCHGFPPRWIARLRQRAAAEPPRELRAHPAPVRYALLAALCHQRTQEITDNLVELLIGIIHKIGVRAEQKVEEELLADLQRVPGKTNLLYDLAAAALTNPDGRVRDVLFPVVGEQTLWDLVCEYEAAGAPFRRRVHKVMRASYQSYYRRMVPQLLAALEFRSNNAVHQPVIRALALLKQHAGSQQHYYTAHRQAPIVGVVRPVWRDLLVEPDPQGGERVNRINYEICVLTALREKLRCKEIWVVGADRWRNPDDDLPADFAERRDEYYAALGLPRTVAAFLKPLRQRLGQALDGLDRSLPRNREVRILKQGNGWIRLSPLPAQPEPTTLEQLKADIARRWPMTNLLDVLKEADLRIGFTHRFTSVASRAMLDRATLQRRLLLCLYALGTNTGLKRISAGRDDESYRDLTYVRRRFLQRENLRAAIADVVNALLSVRQAHLWGEGTTACASDSKKFGAWDQNLMTEWHVRYGGRGVMIYWHVERKSVCIYSQLKRCSSSEVAAMIEGVLRHCTDVEVTRNYVDSHGQSEVAFAFCHLLGFDLLPRLKGLHAQKLYRPEAGQADAFPHLQPVLTRPIRWELIAQQYDFYGRGGEIATNRHDDQELAMLALHLLQNCLVYINTLMIQRVLAEPEWARRLTEDDLRALTPLFYTHVNPYGTFELDMDTRLALEPPTAAGSSDDCPS